MNSPRPRSPRTEQRRTAIPRHSSRFEPGQTTNATGARLDRRSECPFLFAQLFEDLVQTSLRKLLRDGFDLLRKLRFALLEVASATAVPIQGADVLLDGDANTKPRPFFLVGDPHSQQRRRAG